VTPEEGPKLPAFASEDEERAFWDEHDPLEYFTEPADVVVKLKKQKKRMVSVRIDEALHAELKSLGERHGLPYQKIMRELLRQSVANIARKEGRKPNI